MTRRLTKSDHHKRDAMRRWTRRGMARSVLEHQGNKRWAYDHPIGAEFASQHSTSRIEQYATERNPAGSTGTTLIGMAMDRSNPNAARWPK